MNETVLAYLIQKRKLLLDCVILGGEDRICLIYIEIQHVVLVYIPNQNCESDEKTHIKIIGKKLAI